MKLKTGGILYKEEYNSKTKKYDLIDVTDKAPAYLAENVELENVTVRDIYFLISKYPSIQEILERNYIKEFLAHIATNPKNTHQPNKENPESDIAHIEIYHNGYYDPELNRLDFDNIPAIHGCSQTLKKEYNGHLPGSRITWSLSFTPIANILDLEVKLDTMVVCQQDNYISAYDFTTKLKFERKTFTLFEVLNAITWELSFHGSPEENEEAGEQLKDMVENLHESLNSTDAENDDEEEAPVVFTSIEDLFSSNEFIQGFSFIDSSINKKTLNLLMHYLPNKVDVAIFFGVVFPQKVMVKEIYAGLTAYEYRHKMSEADDELLLSKEMKEIINKKQGLRNTEATFIEDRFFELVEELGSSTTIAQIHDLEIF